MSLHSDSASRPLTVPSERRQVSVLFADMVGYTANVERLGEDRALDFTQAIYQKLKTTVREHGGAVRSFAGDSVMAVFGIPDTLEDAALRACRTAMSIHAAVAAAGDEFEATFGVRPTMRVGVSSGAAVTAPVQGEGAELTAVGNTVNLASRIQSIAPAGGCLICDATRRLVEWLVEVEFDAEYEIKGVAKPQKLWGLLSIRKGATRFDVSIARGLSTYIGRSDELATMSAALAETPQGSSVIDLVAEPGLGKTRLVFEFLQRVKDQDAVVLSGQCAEAAQQTPFFPFLEVVQKSFRIQEEDIPAEVARKLESGLRILGVHSPENTGLLMNLLGLAPPEGTLDGLDGVLIGLRTRDLLPELLKARCRLETVVLLIEDMHWIDTASAQLLRRLIDSGGQTNLLMIHTRRPEYLPSWHGKAEVRTLALKPLTESDIRYLMVTRLGVDDLPEALIGQVTERAGGNPLFGEEILNFLIQQGALRIENGKAVFDAELGQSALPASMQSLLTAKIDRLDPQDRALLQAAAAIGKRFDPGLLSLVIDATETTGPTLRRLQEKDIVYRESGTSEYIFKHVLLRDSVYESLLSARRADLHLAIAQALERRNADRPVEAAESLAYHYSLTDRTDLAFTYNALAGAKSLGVYSLNEANRYFASALALYQQDPGCAHDAHFAAFLADYALSSNISLRVRTMIELATSVRPILDRFGDSRHHVHFLHHYVSCLIWNGRYLDALAVQQDLSAMAGRLGDQQSGAYALVSELAMSCYCGHLSSENFDEKQREAEGLLAGLDDAYLQNFFLAHMGWNAVGRGRVLEALAAAENMIVVGREMKDPRSLGYGTAMKALIALISDDYETALEKSEEALGLSRAAFEIAIANASRHASLVPLEKPGAAEEVKRYVDLCTERGWTLFKSTPDTMLGIALAVEGRIGDGLRHIENNITEREREGYHIAADWYRLFLCEVYLEVLSGEGGASLSLLMRNIGPLGGIILFGEKRILALLEHVRGNQHFDRDGHHIGRLEMILGLLYKIKKKKPLALQHLTEAHRIVAPTGPSPMLARIETALAALGAKPETQSVNPAR